MSRLLYIGVMLALVPAALSKDLPPNWWLMQEEDPFAALLAELGDDVPARLRAPARKPEAAPPPPPPAQPAPPPPPPPARGQAGSAAGGSSRPTFASSDRNVPRPASRPGPQPTSRPQPQPRPTSRPQPRPRPTSRPRPRPTSRPRPRPRPTTTRRPGAAAFAPPRRPAPAARPGSSGPNSLGFSDPFERRPSSAPIIFPEPGPPAEPVQRIPAREAGVVCTCVPAGSCAGAQKETVGSCGPRQVCCAGQYTPKCGRIIPGPPMQRHEVRVSHVPWTAALLELVPDGIIFTCGGVLIHPQVVLTAARCVEKLGKRVSSLAVRLGEEDLLSADEQFPHQEFKVQDILVHQNYSRQHKYNDLALLFLAEAAALRPGLDTVCVRRDGGASGGRCTVQGYGIHKSHVDDFDLRLREAAQSAISPSACEAAVRRRNPGFQLHESFTCTDSDMTCDLGEDRAGSPLTCAQRRSGEHQLRGLVAWAVGCSETDSPGIYTDVTQFYDWIDYHVTDYFGYIESYFGFNQV